jgi:large subunit ribosomal protein L24
MAGTHVKRDDIVVVISGEDRGKRGKVLKVNREKQRLTVEGINVRKRAMRRSTDNPQGGIVEKECPIHISNVMLDEKWDSRQKNRGPAATAQK